MQNTQTKKDTTRNVIPFRHQGEFYFSHGVKAFQQKHFERAEKWMKKAIECSPKNALYLCQLSVLYTEMGEYHRANEVLQKVLDTNENLYTDCYYLLANNYAHLGLFYESKKYADKYLDVEKDGEFKEEVEELLSLIDQVFLDELEEDDLEFENEDELMIYQETAFYHLEHKEWTKALDVLEEMIMLYPEYSQSKHEYAYALFENGDHEEAITLEEAWFEKDEKSLHSMLNLTYFYHQTNHEKANSFQSLINNVYPTYEPQKLKMAITFARCGEYEKAYQRFQSLRSKSVTNYMSYYYWFSRTLEKLDFHEESQKLWEKGIHRHLDLKIVYGR
ncbi:hypothetical protein CEY16_08840 [Halalkalibacillus sediminis]|uniref:Tetratricopeptide repeat protein n=1 Tax=Halalkalibacillus sediminis TaxID=2018042 RepID=A0A2I0QUJ8_9BACI|nr:tetratricopeptide repeat protein [Halalkalibacillus sediminis]PKR78017.1 hypothetical protein CEY16_08840 [Halalkalibacillus sediminis]